MSVLSIIAFVVLLALLITVSVIRNRANNLLYTKLHPAKKGQEEFLKACELYLEYRNNSLEHSDPVADAKYDAAVWSRTGGFLPMALDQLPVHRTDRRLQDSVDYKVILRADGEPSYLTYEAIQTVNQAAFLECRKQDQLLSGYSQDSRFWNEGTFNAAEWEDYCAEMNRAFNRMVERFQQEIDDGTEKGPRMDN